MATRGFVGRRRSDPTGRVPPGQYLTDGFPVLSAGPTPRTVLDAWTFAFTYGNETLASWTWQEFLALPHSQVTVDIHCVTKWSKLDTVWEGIAVDTLLAAANLEPPAAYVTAFCDGGYTTNLPVADLRDGKAMVAFRYGGAALGARARRAGAPSRPPLVLLEIGQVGAGPALHEQRRAGLLGVARLSSLRRSLARTTILG